MRDASPESVILQGSGLVKSYRSGTREIQVLRGVDFTLSAGNTVSIRGESGSGKSTLLNILAGIETPDAGSIRWEQRSVLDIPGSRLPNLRARHLGFVFQSYYLIPELNAHENVALAARIAGQSRAASMDRAEQLLNELGLQDRLKSLPQQLSGGERQRTAIARALVNQPKVVLADEPTGNLDEETAERVMEQFLRVVTELGTSLVLVTHHPGFASRTERQLILEDGQLR